MLKLGVTKQTCPDAKLGIVLKLTSGGVEEDRWPCMSCNKGPMFQT